MDQKVVKEIADKAKQYMATHPNVSHGEAIDAVLAAALKSYGQNERAQVAGEVIDGLVQEHLRTHPELKGDYAKAMEAVATAHPDLARSYEASQNPRLHSMPGEDAREQAATRARERAEAGNEVDRKVQEHLARNPDLKGDYATAQEAVLATDSSLRSRYEGRS